MKTLSRLLILLCLLRARTSHAQAQAAAPQFYIVDAMPVTQESMGEPKNSMIGLDFFIGANPRPAWWGRDFVDHFGNPEDFKAHLTQSKAGQTGELELIYSVAYTPRWNETLGLYTVRVRAPMKREFWPKNMALSYAGTLPVIFSDQAAIDSPVISQTNLPFAVAFDARPPKGYADAQLVAPAPSVWVKWVRVFRLEPDATPRSRETKYEADIMVAGRAARAGEPTLGRSMQFTDADGVPIRKNARFGYMSKGFDQSDTNSAPVPTPYRTTRVRFIWGENPDDEAFADPWVSQTFRYGNKEMMSIRFPIRREGKLLEGDIAPRDWVVKPFAEAE